MNELTAEDCFLFEIGEDDEFETLIKTELASHFAILLDTTGKSRTEIAEILDWKKSRVTALLSGNSNPTLKTIYEFSRALGFNFSVNFTEPGKSRARQPWELEEVEIAIGTNISHSDYITPEGLSYLGHIAPTNDAPMKANEMNLRIQSRREVQENFQNGHGYDNYIPLGNMNIVKAGYYGYITNTKYPNSTLISDTKDQPPFLMANDYINIKKINHHDEQAI